MIEFQLEENSVDPLGFKYSCDLKEICRPLFEKTEITFFEYIRVTSHDQSVRLLSTNPTRTKLLFSSKSSNTSIKNMFSLIRDMNLRYYFWDSGVSRVTNSYYRRTLENYLSISAGDFDIAHGFVVIEHANDFSSVYSFGTASNKAHVREFYINNLDVLEKFIFSFKDRSLGLLKECGFSKEKNSNDDAFDQISNISNGICHNEDVKFNIKRFYLTIDTTVHGYITLQECKTILLLSKGCSVKEIAILLNISGRTVESYLKSARERLLLRSNAQLISIFWRSSLARLALSMV